MEWVSGNIYIRPNDQPCGVNVGGHTHNFDHTTIFWTPHHVKAKLPGGQVIERDFPAASHALIRKEVEHDITSLPHEVPQYVQQLVEASEGVVAGTKTTRDLAAAIEMFWTIQKALPGKFWCVYSHRTPQGDISQEYTGWDHANR